jgi:hypothetical protein
MMRRSLNCVTTAHPVCLERYAVKTIHDRKAGSVLSEHKGSTIKFYDWLQIETGGLFQAVPQFGFVETAMSGISDRSRTSTRQRPPSDRHPRSGPNGNRKPDSQPDSPWPFAAAQQTPAIVFLCFDPAHAFGSGRDRRISLYHFIGDY